MPRLKFGAFLAPHHPVGEHPLLQFRRDLDLVEHLDRLGYDEFWCGEHHSSGWEMIGSPEMFLAAAGERSKRIKLATGVISLPYHHPFNVAQRMVQLDWMTGGRAIFGSGPGALASDAHTLAIDPMVQRDRQDEAIGAIRRFMKGERVTMKSDWFTLQDAQLQLLPLQEEMECAVASQISPSGMTLAGKHGIGVISIGSLAEEGLSALPTQWGFAEAAAKKHGTTVSRNDWRVLLSWHIAETREKAVAEARFGLLRHHNDYIVGTLQRPGATPFKDPDEAVEKTAFGASAAATIGTPDDLVARFGPDVADCVAALTKDMRLPEAQREAAYLRQLLAGDWRVAVCKLADGYDNLCDSRVLSPAGRAKQLGKVTEYLEALHPNIPPEARQAFEMVSALAASLRASLTSAPPA